MKDMFKIAGIFAIMVIIIPMIGFLAPSAENATVSEAVSEISEQNTVQIQPYDNFILLDSASGEIKKMTISEYVKGAVLAEMPASFHDEALKAQAVAAHTYAVRRIQQQLAYPDPELKGAYASDDSTRYQAYFSPEQAAYFYGSLYEEYDGKITALVNEVINEIIVYNGEPVVAAFHSSSCGMTESAENVWGTHIDYLVPVESPEKTEPVTVTFTADELSARLTQSEYGITLPENKQEWLKIISTGTSGSVTEISAGDIILSGIQLRTLLNLKSANFTFKYNADSDSFVFTTKGSGHGVGLSQYGAEAMADQGYTYKEILLHYYKGAEIYSTENTVT